MPTLFRSLLAATCLTISLLHPATHLVGAELRTTLCGRPVCRTVAIGSSPEPATNSLPPEAVFEDFGGDCHGCLDGCSACCFPRREFWVGTDYLLGWRHSVRFPPLVTTSPNNTPVEQAGVLPGATVIYPVEPVGDEARPGFRLTIGTWLDPFECWAVEGRYYTMEDHVTSFSAQSNGDPILARPFFDAINNEQASRLLAFPGVVSPGSIDITTESELEGGDALFRRGLCRWDSCRLDFLVGYQFASLDESLLISDSLTDVDPNNLIVDGTIFAITDQFVTRNEYHAATIGAGMKGQCYGWRWELLGKIGLGNMHQTVTISGTTQIAVPGQEVVVQQSGLLAGGGVDGDGQPRSTNLGRFTQDTFSASPEVNVKVAYALNRCIDLSFGYTFLYFTNVAQPGRMIDVDLFVPTDRFRIRDSEYWLHALQCGLTMRF